MLSKPVGSQDNICPSVSPDARAKYLYGSFDSYGVSERVTLIVSDGQLGFGGGCTKFRIISADNISTLKLPGQVAL